MPKGPFSSTEFTPTEWSTSAEKADFGNTLLHFLEMGCPRTLFNKKFYTRLSMSFGNIAHHNIHGFYEEWFTTEVDKGRFVKHLLTHPCYGDPKFTFSDVERAVQAIMRRRNYLGLFRVKADAETRTIELAQLERLEAKYRAAAPAPVADPKRAPAAVAAPAQPVQGLLFS